MLHIAICDDRAEDCERLHTALMNQFSARRQEVKIALYPCGEALLAGIEEDGRNFDLVFLDIYMTGLSGMETAYRLRAVGQKVPLIFLTSSQDFAVESYEVSAAGYLLKPLDETRLSALLDRILNKAECPRLALKCGGSHRYFDYEEIFYIESRGYQLFLHTMEGDEIRATGKLDEVEMQLGDPRFLRCHQSYLVNMDSVSKAGDDFLLRNGDRVPIRVRSRKAMTDAYYRYFVEQTTTRRAREEGAYV